jgi:hypothetical protein
LRGFVRLADASQVAPRGVRVRVVGPQDPPALREDLVGELKGFPDPSDLQVAERQVAATRDRVGVVRAQDPFVIVEGQFGEF